MSKKLTKKMIEELIKEELAKAEQERLDEFKVSVNKPLVKDLYQGLSINKSDLYKAAGDGNFPNDAHGAKKAAKALGALGGASSTDIDKGDFKAAKNRGIGDDLYKFGDTIQQATSDSDIKRDWAGTSPPAGNGPWGTYVAVPSAKMPAKDLYAAIEKALDGYVADNTDADAKNALTAYAQKYVKDKRKGQYKKSKYGTKGKWDAVINAVLGGSPVTSGLAQAALKDLSKALKPYEPQDISRPEMATVGAEKSQFSQDAIFAFDGLFKAQSASTLENRVKAISKLSEAMVEGNKNTLDDLFGSGTSGNDKRAFLNGIVCMDYIAKFAKEIDHGAGAYFFEAFCALITGGKVAGKGGKAGDFTLALDDGSTGSGSSKYLNAYASKQAVSGFTAGVPVQYIGAFKRKNKSGAISSAGVSQPEEIVVIDFYLFEITLSQVNQYNTTGNTIDASGTTSGLTTSFVTNGSTVDIKFNYGGLTPTARVHLAKRKNQSFKNALEDQVKKSDQDLRDSYKLFKEYFAQTRKADVQVKSYLGSGNLNDGTQALRAITEADDQMVDMFNLLRPASGGVTGSGTNRQLKENKMTELDLMIENMVKQFIKGKLND